VGTVRRGGGRGGAGGGGTRRESLSLRRSRDFEHLALPLETTVKAATAGNHRSRNLPAWAFPPPWRDRSHHADEKERHNETRDIDVAANSIRNDRRRDLQAFARAAVHSRPEQILLQRLSDATLPFDLASSAISLPLRTTRA